MNLECQWMHPARQKFFYDVFMAYVALQQGGDVSKGHRGADIKIVGLVKLVRAMEEDSLAAAGTLASRRLIKDYPRTRELISGKRAGAAYAAFERVYGKGVLHLEHPVSVTGFINQVVASADAGELTLEKFSSLLEPVRPIWILRTENKILDDAGYRSHRPEGWMMVYASLGIEVTGLK